MCIREKSDLSGNSEWPLPSNPKLSWSLNSGSATKSSPVISDGLIYFGTDKGSLVACDTEGNLAWKTATGDPIEAPPLVSDNNVIYSTSEGILYAANKKTGRIVWSYKTDNQIAGSANIWKSGTSSGIIAVSYTHL